MDIYKLFEEVYKTDITTPLDTLKHLQMIIFRFRSQIENTLFREYCSFYEKKEYQIYKNQNYIDKQKMILDNMNLLYQQKEEKYKYPANLTSIQKEITLYEVKKQKHLSNIKTDRETTHKYMNHLVDLDENRIIQEKKLIDISTQTNLVISNWDYNLCKITDTYKVKNHKIDFHQELNKYFFKKNQDEYFKLLNFFVQKELLLVGKYKNLQINTQDKINKLPNSQELEIENLRLMLFFEKDILKQAVELNQKNLQKECVKFEKIYTKYYNRKQYYSQQKEETLQLEFLKKSKMYDVLEENIKNLQNIEWKITSIDMMKKDIKNKLALLETDIQIMIHQNDLLDDKIKNLEIKKNKIIPGIIKKYHFYMNFYHHDLKETKIKINVSLRNLEKIKQKNFDMLEKTKITRQKINILKKLQININQKIDEHQTRN